MHGWMDGWVDGWRDGGMDGWMHECLSYSTAMEIGEAG